MNNVRLTKFAAVDLEDGAIWGTGDTREAAAKAARLEFSRGRADPDQVDELDIVPCSEAAVGVVDEWGGAPSQLLMVSHSGVWLRSEENGHQQ